MSQSSPLRPSMSRRGFTLVEVLVTLTVLAVLVGTLMYALKVGRERAERTTLASDISLLAQAQEAYYGAAGSYAPTMEALGAYTPTRNTQILGMLALPNRFVALAERPGTVALCGVAMSRQASTATNQRVQCATDVPLGAPAINQLGAVYQFDATALLATAVTTPVAGLGPQAAWALPDVDYIGWSFGDGAGFLGTRDDATQATHLYAGDPQGRIVRVAFWMNDGRLLQSTLTLDAAGDPTRQGEPTAAFTVSPAGQLAVGMDVVLNAGASATPTGKITDYRWTIEGQNLSGPVVRVRLATAGSLPVTLTVTTDAQRVGTATRTLSVRPAGAIMGRPTAQWSGSPMPAIAGRAVTLDAGLSVDPSGRITDYQWSFTGATIRVTDGDVASPGMTGGNTPNDTSGFVGSPGGSPNGATYVTGRRITVLWPNAGQAMLTLTVRSSTGQTHTVSDPITILSPTTPPGITILPGQATIRAGQALSLQTSVTGAATSALDWSMGDGTRLAGAAVSHRYMVPGRYTVQVTAQAGRAGEATGTALITVLPNLLPKAAFSVQPDPPTLGTDITFDARGSQDLDGQLVLYRWLWSDGEYRLGPVVTRTFATAGTYTVTLTVQDDARGQHSITVPITVNSTPVARFTVPEPLQADSVARFDASTSSDPLGDPIVAYIWTWPDGSVDSSAAATIDKLLPAAWAPQVPVTLRVRTAGSLGVTTRTLPLNRPPTAAFSWSPVRPLAGSAISFTNTSTDPDGDVLTATWTLGANPPTGVWEPSTTFPSAGSYPVTLTVRDGRGGVATSSAQTVRVVALPIARLSLPAGVAPGVDVIADGRTSVADTAAGLTIARYHWTFGDGRNDSTVAGTRTVRWPSAGTYAVTLIVEDSDGNRSLPVTQNLTVGAAFLASFTVSPGTGPTGTRFQLASTTVAPNGVTLQYRWLVNGAAYGPNADTTSLVPMARGDYALRLIVWDNFGNVDTSAAQTVRVTGGPPLVAITGGPTSRTRLEDALLGLTLTATDGDPILTTGWELETSPGVWTALSTGDATIGALLYRVTDATLGISGGPVGERTRVRAWATDADGTGRSAAMDLDVTNLPPVCGAITNADTNALGRLVWSSTTTVRIQCTDPENDTPLSYTWRVTAGTITGANDQASLVMPSSSDGVAGTIVQAAVRDSLNAETTVVAVFAGTGAPAFVGLPCTHTPSRAYALPGDPIDWTSSNGCFSGGRVAVQRGIGPWQPAGLIPALEGGSTIVHAPPSTDAVVRLNAPSTAGRQALYVTLDSAGITTLTDSDASGDLCILGAPTDGQLDGSTSGAYWYGPKRYVLMYARWTAPTCGEHVELVTGPTLDPDDPQWTGAGTQPLDQVTGVWDLLVYPIPSGGQGIDGKTQFIAVGVRTIGGGLASRVMPLDFTTDYDDENELEPNASPLGLFFDRGCRPNEMNCGYWQIDAGTVRLQYSGVGDPGPVGEEAIIWAETVGATGVTYEWVDRTGGGNVLLGNGASIRFWCGRSFVPPWTSVRATAWYTDALGAPRVDSRDFVIECSQTPLLDLIP